MYDTSLLDSALAARAAAREQERQAVLRRTLELLEEATAKFGLRQAYLFGSIAASGRFSDHSDIDIAAVNLPPEHFFALAAFLSVHLGRDVDLVMLEDIHFADKIRREGLLWTSSG